MPEPDDLRLGDDPPLWLSHHWPHQYDRCVSVRGRLVCRRCLVLYPISLAVVAVFGLLVEWPERLDAWLLWLLPLPAVLDLLGEHLGVARSTPRRLVAVTVPLGVGCGRLYLRYLDHPADRLVLGVVLGYGGLCLAAVLLLGGRQARRSADAAAAAEPLPEVRRVDEVAGVVAGEARRGDEREQGEGQADRPAGEPEPGHR